MPSPVTRGYPHVAHFALDGKGFPLFDRGGPSDFRHVQPVPDPSIYSTDEALVGLVKDIGPPVDGEVRRVVVFYRLNKQLFIPRPTLHRPTVMLMLQHDGQGGPEKLSQLTMVPVIGLGLH